MSSAHINHTQARNGKSSAVCCICNRKCRPVKADRDGEPELWSMPRGWSEAPYPADHIHPDGSIGSMFTCPGCNKLLKNGAALTMRGGQKTVSA